MNRQKQILIFLLLTLVLVVIWSFLRWPRQKTVATLKQTTARQPLSAKIQGRANNLPSTSDLNQAQELHLELLEQVQPDLVTSHRNIFKPLFIDQNQNKQKAVAPKPPTQPKPPQIVATPQKELIKFTFLGLLHMDNQKTIFLTKDKEILLVKKGDVFAGRFKARELDEHSLRILVNDTGEEIVVPLVENQTLAAGGR